MLTANMEDRWVIYSPASYIQADFEKFRRHLETGIAVQGTPYTEQLLAVAVDLQNQLVKGLMIDVPTKGPMFQLMAAYRFKGKSIPWPMRQKWAKKIVRGFNSFHTHGHAIGGLPTYSSYVVIDEQDDAVVMASRPSQATHPAYNSQNGQKGLLPPGYRTETFKYGNNVVDSKFDIFQLGLLLWHFYRDGEQQRSPTFCSLAGCSNAKNPRCERHGNPVALPQAATNVPDYLDQIIARCRQESPHARLTAETPLDMFPTDE
jgi:hypothetical protein